MVIVIRRDGSTLFSRVDWNKLQFYVKDEVTLIFAKLGADLINL